MRVGCVIFHRKSGWLETNVIIKTSGLKLRPDLEQNFKQESEQDSKSLKKKVNKWRNWGCYI